MATTTDDDLFGAEHVAAYRETGGERGYHWRGTTILLLDTVGRRTGAPHTAPLIYRPDGDRFVIVASKGGRPEHPAGFLNLEARPETQIQVLDEQIPVRMAEAEGAERERLWRHMTEVWPDYDAYQRKTDRRIPIGVLVRR